MVRLLGLAAAAAGVDAMGSCSRMGGRASSGLGADGASSPSPFFAPISLVRIFCQASAMRVRRFRSPSSRLMSSAVGDEGCQGPGPQSAATSPLAAVATNTDDAEICRALVLAGGTAGSEETAGRSTRVEHSDQLVELRRAPGIDMLDRLSKAGGRKGGGGGPVAAAQARCAILLLKKKGGGETIERDKKTKKRRKMRGRQSNGVYCVQSGW